MSKGHVAIVGAGPGDPDLLTVRAARLLAKADIVFYDSLVEPAVVELAPNAIRVCVGKRAGARSTPQAKIERLMLRAALRGKRVVRLKGGDPFVLGRGGEEALTLAREGVPFEVVPGISSAIAAPGLAGIPVTHRGVAIGFVVVSGHSVETFAVATDGINPEALTLVVLMGYRHRAPIAKTLLDRGWLPSTPCSIHYAAATSRARNKITTLDRLYNSTFDDMDDAATMVIGQVVDIGTEIREMTTTEESASLPRVVSAAGSEAR